MKPGDIVRHKISMSEGIVISIIDEYAEVLLTKCGMYNPEAYKIKELEVIKSEN